MFVDGDITADCVETSSARTAQTFTHSQKHVRKEKEGERGGGGEGRGEGERRD